MKLQVLTSAALVLCAILPSALSEETSHAVAKPIEKFEDQIQGLTGLYDEDEEEDSYDMDYMLVSKDDDKKKKKSKKSNKKKSKRSSNKRKKSKRSYKRKRHYKRHMCGRKMRKKDRKLCRELERDFCSRKSRRKRNRSFCRHLGFPRDYESFVISDDEDELPQEYQVLIEEVAKTIDLDIEEEYEEEDIVYIESDSDTDTDRVDWDNAKNKTKNAARRTADGAKRAADKTAEGSKKAWDATKDGSKKAWDKTKDWGRRTFTNSGFSTTKSSSVAVAGAVVLAMFI